MVGLQEILDALQSPIRREILALIWDEARPVGEIAAAFELRPPTISQHLRVLRQAGLVTMTATGNFRHYRANQEVLRGLHRALPQDSPKWQPADDLPETGFASARTIRAVTVAVEVPLDVVSAHHAFSDPVIYTRWLGVPVTISDDRFAATMEWGTRIRGRYEVQAPPYLIAMRWDFEDDNVPVPGGEMVGYLRFVPAGDTCHVEVHQLCETPEQAEFMEVAWSMVLGRFQEGAQKGFAAPEKSRASRAKRRFEAH